MIQDLNERSREVFRQIVEAYVETGEPIGSRSLSRRLGLSLSAATIRNVMADLEEQGLIHAPHTSAGRLPTDVGLRLFVDGLMQLGELSDAERQGIEARCAADGRTVSEVLTEATRLVSGLSAGAGLVVAPKLDVGLRHVEFVPLGPGRCIVVLVSDDGQVENRVLETPPGLPMSALAQASNYLNARAGGRTMHELRATVQSELEEQRAVLDTLTSKLVADGLAIRGGGDDTQLIVSGQSRLLDSVTALEDLERVRRLFEQLEARQTTLKLMEAADGADGVRIFIGSQSQLFDHAGCSLLVAPFSNRHGQIVGAIGVIGPTRLNYARVIPMLDYTARVVGDVLG